MLPYFVPRAKVCASDMREYRKDCCSSEAVKHDGCTKKVRSLFLTKFIHPRRWHYVGHTENVSSVRWRWVMGNDYPSHVSCGLGSPCLGADGASEVETEATVIPGPPSGFSSPRNGDVPFFDLFNIPTNIRRLGKNLSNSCLPW